MTDGLFRASAAVTAALLACLLCRPAYAEVTIARLEVTPSTDASACGDAASLAAAANRVLRRDVVNAPGSEAATLRFQIVYSLDESGYLAAVHESGAHQGDRTIESREPTCGALSSALAVTIAMMIDAADAADRAASPSGADEKSADAGASSTPRATRTTQPADTAPIDANDTTPPSKVRTAFDLVYFEGLGNGVYDSVNYEHLFWGASFGLRAGFGFSRVKMSRTTPSFVLLNGGSVDQADGAYWYDEYAVPVVLSWYWGSASHKLQVGAGATTFYRTDAVGKGGTVDGVFSASTSKGFDVAGSAVLAYRYIPRGFGPTIGGGFTPLFGKGGFLPWVSLDVGLDF